MLRVVSALLLLMLCSLPIVSSAHARARAIKCSSFLHNTDGSWRSFESAVVVGSNGPVTIEAGEVFKRSGPRDKADIARILETLCG